MVFCMNCGQQLPDGANFCLNCGTKLGETKTENTQRKTVYDGDLHKCPNCGDILGAFVTVCSSCGYELRSKKTSSTVQEFIDKLNQIEKNREIKKSGFFNGNPNKLTNADEQRINLIRTFAIPNTKEDIYEFLILASSNINTKWWAEGNIITVAQEMEANAWMSKFEQAYQKAELMFCNDPMFDSFKRLYKEKKAAANKKKWEFPLTMAGSILGVIIIMSIFALIMSFLGR